MEETLHQDNINSNEKIKNYSFIFFIINIIFVIIRKIGIFYLYITKKVELERYKLWHIYLDEFSFINEVEPKYYFGNPRIYLNFQMIIILFITLIFFLIIKCMIKKDYDKIKQKRFIIFTIIHFVLIFYYLFIFFTQQTNSIFPFYDY